MVGGGTPLADEYLQIKVGGDLALFQALGHLLLAEEERNPGTVVDRSFIDAQTDGFDAYRDARGELDWAETEKATGLAREQIETVAGMLIRSKATIFCWALGVTQQPHSVDTIKEMVNVLLLQGNFGKPGAGRLPGPRALQRPGRPDHGHLGEAQGMAPRSTGQRVRDRVPARSTATTRWRPWRRSSATRWTFLCPWAATSRSPARTPKPWKPGMQRIGLTVHISTKPNRSHVVHGRTSLILPTLGRTDKDDKHPKGAQFLSVEDSMSVVHSTQGRLQPVSEHLLAEPVIVARMAEATFGPDHPVDWKAMAEDYDVVRDHISRVLPGFEDFNARVRTKNGFVLPNPPRDTRSFKTDIGRGRFTVSPLEYLTPPDGHLVLQTIRSHDQYNTTFYGLDDRYRGISGGRRVILVHPEDLAELGFKDRDLVDVVSTFRGHDRQADKFRLVAYPTAKGCAAAYFPEANALVHKENVARESNTPGFKAMFVRFVPHEAEPESGEESASLAAATAG